MLRLLPILFACVAVSAPYTSARAADADEAVSVDDGAESSFERRPRPPRPPRPRPPRGRPPRQPPKKLGEPDLWLGADLGLMLHPLPGYPNIKFDMGIGQRHGRGLIAGNLKIGVNIPMYFATELNLEIGGTVPAKPAQFFSALQLGVGLTVDSPVGTELWEFVTPGNKRREMPTFILGGSFGAYFGEMKRKTQFRLAVQPRFRGMVATFADGGTSLLPAAELSFCVGADVI